MNRSYLRNHEYDTVRRMRERVAHKGEVKKNAEREAYPLYIAAGSSVVPGRAGDSRHLVATPEIKCPLKSSFAFSSSAQDDIERRAAYLKKFITIQVHPCI